MQHSNSYEIKTDKQNSRFNSSRGVQKFTLLEKVGSGTYGVVYKAVDNQTSEIVAIKKIKLDKEDDGVPCTALREIALLKSLKHPNVIQLRDVIYVDDGAANTELQLVFDFCEFDLKQYIKSKGGNISPTEVRKILQQILEGTAYCHANSVMHRDLKPQNILIDREGQVKLIDFGLARAFNLPLKDYTHEVVTLWYRAPEVLLGEKTYTPSIDLWSIGTIMAEMSERARPLLPGDSEIDQLFRCFRLLGTPNTELWPEALQYRDFKANFPKWKPQDLFQICPTLGSTGIDLLSRLLALDPKLRFTAREALEHPFFY